MSNEISSENVQLLLRQIFLNCKSDWWLHKVLFLAW